MEFGYVEDWRVNVVNDIRLELLGGLGKKSVW